MNENDDIMLYGRPGEKKPEKTGKESDPMPCGKKKKGKKGPKK